MSSSESGSTTTFRKSSDADTQGKHARSDADTRSRYARSNAYHWETNLDPMLHSPITSISNIIRTVIQMSPKPSDADRVEQTLSFEEAQQRALQAANELEELVGTSNEVDEARRNYFASEYMALLAEKFVIAPPTITPPTNEAMGTGKE
jgi:hypothetical protein